MKTAVYYILLLVFIALITGFVFSGGNHMSMGQVTAVCSGLVLYTVALGVVGEGRAEDERAQYHRYLSTRIGFIAGVSVLCIGLLFQLITHTLDYWLLAGLIIVNLSKIMSLLYLHNKQ